MKRYLSPFFLAIGCQLLAIGCLNAQTGTWTKVATNAPHANDGGMVLLTDGTVLCHNTNGGTYGTGWDRLTPNASGSYINGTWTSIASMGYGRLFFPTQVLPSGKVFAAGGEYGSGATRGEVYDPVANTWTATGTVVSSQNIYDGNSEILPDGTVLVGVQSGLHPSFDNLFYTPSTNAWTTAPINVSPYNHDEAQWLKLPDSSILFVGIASTASVRYRPQTNTWVNDGTVPVNLYDVYGEEAGPAFMLPNGKAVFFGARGQNAIYAPTGDVNPGTWTAAASFPLIRGTQVGQADAPGCMMVNGHILLACSPIGTSSSNEFKTPIYFVEYNYVTNTCTQVLSTLPGLGGDSVPGESCYQGTMIQLPDGNVMFDVNQAGSLSSEYFIYTPGSAAIAQGKPTINSILPDGCPNYKITGKLFNGISEGAAYGDDWQMASNYPIVRLTNGTNVYYAKTTNWNRIGAVQTDSLEDTAVFTLPTIPSGTYSLYVVANGFASNPVLFKVLGISSISATNITCATPVGTASVTASGGLSPLTYTWNPGGNTNASASNLSAGTYTVTVTDNNGCIVTASAIITGGGTISVSAQVTANITCNGGTNGSATSTASGGNRPYSYSWSGGGGTNTTASGLSAGTYTVFAHDSCGSSGTASVIITQPAAMSVSIASHTNISCFGSGSGSATASTATGGTSPYTYNWSSGLGSSLAVSNLSAGTYSITATDNHGCSAVASTTITQAASSIGVSISSVNNPLCGGGTGNIIANAATGGTSPYTYSWSAGGGTNITTVSVSAGTYTVTATDHNGCTATATATITQPPVFGISINSVANVLCNGGLGSITANAATGGTSPYVYSWTGSGGTNLTVSGVAGTYTLTASDNNGCTASVSAVITQPAPLIINMASQTNVNCNTAGSATANAASGGTSPYVYSWSAGSGTGLTASNLSAGTYTITVTDNNSCTSNASVTITQPAGALGISIATVTNILCNGGSTGQIIANVATGGTSPYTYSWSAGGGTNINSVFLSAGTYIITVTDNLGCTATASAVITQPATFGVSINSVSNVLCYGSLGSITASAATGGTSPYSYAWSAGGGSNLTVVAGSGTYTITASDNNGCTASVSAIITQPAPLLLAGDSINATVGNCNGSAWALVSGGTTPYSYLWTGGLTTDTISNQCAAGYCCTITDANGCMDSVCVTINSVTGTNKLTSNNGQLTIYPNPNNGKFTLEIKSEKLILKNVEVFNILGEQIYSQLNIYNSTFNIDLSSQPDGVYLYRVIKEDGSLMGSGKIIIQK